MSTAEILSLISLISYIVAGFCGVLAVFLWFFLKIPSVFGNLTGRTAKKSIEKMRQSNQKVGQVAAKAVAKPAQSHAAPAAAPVQVRREQPAAVKRQKVTDNRPGTGLLEDNKAMGTDMEQTELLIPDVTCLLEEETGRLPTPGAAAGSVRQSGGKKLIMLDEVMLIHTDEEVIG